MDLNNFDENNILKCSIEIDSDFFRTGLFPLYFWLGKVGGLLGDNYPYDVVDSMSFLNFNSNKSKIELGYDSQNPGSPFNLKFNLIYLHTTLCALYSIITRSAHCNLALLNLAPVVPLCTPKKTPLFVLCPDQMPLTLFIKRPLIRSKAFGRYPDSQLIGLCYCCCLLD